MGKSNNNNKISSNKVSSNKANAPAPALAPVRPASIPASYGDAGSGKSYATRGINTNYGTYWAAGPMSDEEVRNFVNNKTDNGVGFNVEGTGPWQGSSTSSPQNPSTTATASYKGIKSIGEGLRIGNNNILSRKEANKISKNTGKSYDQVLGKALSKGLQIGGGAVNKSNKAYKSSKDYLWNSMLNATLGSDFTRKTGRDPLVGMRGLALNGKQAYGGEYLNNGAYTPIVLPKIRGIQNPLTNSTLNLSNTTNSTGSNMPAGTSGDVVDSTQNPLDTTQKDQQDININFPDPLGVGSDVGSFATSWKSNKGKYKNIFGKLGYNAFNTAIGNAMGIGVNSGLK